ncbi:type II secretion system F family protein [Oricola cellulosilytica]|uniref:Type II secretion system F family protein n=1 Tax=Oricola cellulosilytica TaxID=1429082 RepID=A0A4R0PBS3_9HYPH|nr:type II secretion system F family protein [Oricola cellulosilytica]TCD12387.1 type II secretion system F family protein [Oricola cellulosilytica]
MDYSLLILPAGAVVVALGALALFLAYRQEQTRRERVISRLQVRLDDPDEVVAKVEEKKAVEAELAEKAAKRAAAFYASADPENVVRLRQTLMRAGHLDPDALGRFFLVRFMSMGGGVALALGLIFFINITPFSQRGILALGGLSLAGYFLPAFMLKQQVNKRMLEYRNGFPDFMDLMIVCADAGMSLEASIERVSREIAMTYPALSQNLVLVSLELRAGRSINETLKALAERLGVEEVRAFATLLQQSKELGTSLSTALKVFSEEMRHKRMSAAEEKAHALPAKMSIPVTVCILPVVVMIAIIPIIVRFNM